MIKVVIEEAIKKIEAVKEQKVAEIRERIMREKIVPFNSEVDSYRAKALAEIDNELNQRIMSLKQEYETKKQELVKLGEEKKKANAETVLASELAVVSIDYDNAINSLKEQIEKIEA